MKLTLCLLLMLIFSTIVEADTIRFENGEGFNGLVTYHSDRFIVEAQFKDAARQPYPFDRKYVTSVEINDTFINQGPPPEWINKYLYKERPKGEVSIITSQPLSTEPSGNESFPSSSAQPSGMRPPSKSPDEPPNSMPSAIDERGNVNIPRKEYIDEIKFNDKKRPRRTGKLMFINSEVINLAEGKREVSFNRSEVHTIIVGH